MCYQINKIIVLMLLLEAMYTTNNKAFQTNSSQTPISSCPAQNFWLKCHIQNTKSDMQSQFTKRKEEPQTKKQKNKENIFSKVLTYISKTLVALFILKEVLKELSQGVENNYMKTMLELITKTSITVISSIFSEKLSRLAIQLVFKSIKQKIKDILGQSIFKGFTKAVIAKITEGYTKVIGKKIKKKSRKLRKMIKKSELLKRSHDIYILLQEETFKNAKKSCKFIMKGKFKKFIKKKKKKLLKRTYAFLRSQEELKNNSNRQTVIVKSNTVKRNKKRTIKKRLNNNNNSKKIFNHGISESYSLGQCQGESLQTFCKFPFAISNTSKFLFELFSANKKKLSENYEEQKLKFSQSYFSFSSLDNQYQILSYFSFLFTFFGM